MVQKESLIFVIYAMGMVLLAPYGLMALAQFMVVAAMLDLLISTWVLHRGIGLSPSHFFRAMAPNGLLTIWCWSVTWVLGLWLDYQDPESAVQTIGVVALILPWAWLLGLAVLRHPLFGEVRLAARWVWRRSGGRLSALPR